MDADMVKLVVPLTAVAVGVSALLYFLQRAPKELLDKKRKRVRIIDIKELSSDTKRFRLCLGGKNTTLGLPVGKHLSIYAPNASVSTGKWNGQADGMTDRGKAEIERKYTPTTGNETPGYVDLVIKVYRPGTVKMPDGKEVNWENGGKIGLYMDTKKVGDYIEINGPSGINEYLGKGTWKLPGRTMTVKHVGMMAGGTGLTPMLQVVSASLLDPQDATTFSLIYANKTEDDILCKDLLDDCVARSNGRFKLTYTLDFPPANWAGKKGFITQEMIKECLPAPGADSLILMCGPPPMVDFACKKNLEALGFEKTRMVAF